MERRWAVPLLLCAAVTVFAAAGALRAPGPVLLGSPGAEVYGHAWVQEWVSAHWPALPGATDRLDPRAPMEWRVIDPLTTWLAAGLARAAGATAAWNAVLLAGVAGAFAGGWWLAGRLGGDRPTGALATALAPAFAGSVASGLTEDLGVGLLALALGLVATADTPRRWAAAGAALGALAWTGLYVALMGGLGALVVALADDGGRGRPPPRDSGGPPREVGGPSPRDRLRGLVVAVLVAVVVASPVIASQGARLGGVGHRAGATVARYEPHWRVNPHHGADLASFVTPGPDPVDDGALIRLHPAYLGLAVLALAALGVRRGTRRWAVLAAVALLLALGPELRVLGHPTGVPNPLARGAGALPLLGLINHWGRLALLAHVALAALASVGAARLAARWPTARIAAPALVALDLALLSAAPWPLPTTPAAIPALYAALDDLPAGAVLVVPSAGPGVPFQRPLYRQRGHGRVTIAHPNRPGYGVAEDVPLVRWFASLPGARMDPPDPELEASFARLRRLGVAAIVVEDPYVPDVEALLGPPAVRAEGGAAWAVP